MNGMSRYAGALALALVAAEAAAAQNPPPGGQPPAQSQDSLRPFPMGRGPGMFRGGPRNQALRMQIEQRFAQRVQTELGLSDQQMERLKTTERVSRDRRQALNDHEMDLRQAVGAQLKPGVAANGDSLSKLLDAIAANHVARAQDEQQELRELAQFLTPVQRARLLIMRQQLMQRVQAIREGRFNPAVRPGMPPGPQEEEL